MTDSEIIKALECCIAPKCGECPIFNNSEIRRVPGRCVVTLEKNALDLINRLEAENSVLHRDNDRLLEEIQDEKIYSRKIIEKYKSKLINAYKKLKRARTEAVKDFAERLKEYLDDFYHTGEDALLDTTYAIDNLVREMVGDSE